MSNPGYISLLFWVPFQRVFCKLSKKRTEDDSATHVSALGQVKKHKNKTSFLSFLVQGSQLNNKTFMDAYEFYLKNGLKRLLDRSYKLDCVKFLD